MKNEEYLKSLCEKLAYVCFIEDKDDQLKHQGFTHEHIQKFSVRLYINQFINDDNDIEIDLKTYINVDLKKEEGGEQAITIIYHHPVFSPAIIDKFLERDDEQPTKILVHEFGRPNPITLYDAEFALETELGVFVND